MSRRESSEERASVEERRGVMVRAGGRCTGSADIFELAGANLACRRARADDERAGCGTLAMRSRGRMEGEGRV